MIYKKQKVPKIHKNKKKLSKNKEKYEHKISPPPLRDKTLQQILGNQEVQQMFQASEIMAKLFINQPGDIYEQEADRVARHIVDMGDKEVQLKTSAINVQKKGNSFGGESVSSQTEAGITSLKGKGHPLEPKIRDYLQPRFGVDLKDVRVHTDSNADRLARAIRARAFTLGNDVVFAKGEYKPETRKGKKLIAHELTHVLQQTTDQKIKKYSSIYPHIQRTTHGPETPTNAHNWKIPLPPWIAGTIAHGQIATMLRIPIMGIPRASKVFQMIENPPFYIPYGFADLWENTGMQVNIAEIKSTSSGSTLAQQEANHYKKRHNQWTLRYPFTQNHDQNYFLRVGGLLPGGILDLSGITGTDKSLGPFWGDPLKTLHIEADNLGAVVYWCTGQGLQVSPLWYPVFKKLLKDLKDMMNEIKKMIDKVIEGVKPVIDAIQSFINSIVDWGIKHSRILAIIFLIIILIIAVVIFIIGLLGAAGSGGTSTSLSYASAMAAVFIVVGLGALIGINADKLPDATANLAKTIFPQEGNTIVNATDYEKMTDREIPSSKEEASGLIGSFDPVGDFLAAAQPLLNPFDVIGGIFSSMDSVPSGSIAKINECINFLELNGDYETARYTRSILNQSGLG